MCPGSLHDDNCFGTKREAASRVICFAAMMLKSLPTGTGIQDKFLFCISKQKTELKGQ